jgi:hypothetical protein
MEKKTVAFAFREKGVLCVRLIRVNALCVLCYKRSVSAQ